MNVADEVVMGSRNPILALALPMVFLLSACDSGVDGPVNSPGLSVASGPCDKNLAKTASQAGELIHADKDSISFTFEATLNCDVSYAYHSALLDKSTLSLTVEAVDPGDSRARCVCSRALTVSAKAMSGEDYSSVKTLVFYADTIDLIPR